MLFSSIQYFINFIRNVEFALRARTAGKARRVLPGVGLCLSLSVLRTDVTTLLILILKIIMLYFHAVADSNELVD